MSNMRHDPKYLIPWELCYSAIIGPCMGFGINSGEGSGIGGLGSGSGFMV